MCAEAELQETPTNVESVERGVELVSLDVLPAKDVHQAPTEACGVAPEAGGLHASCSQGFEALLLQTVREAEGLGGAPRAYRTASGVELTAKEHNSVPLCIQHPRAPLPEGFTTNGANVHALQPFPLHTYTVLLFIHLSPSILSSSLSVSLSLSHSICASCLAAPPSIELVVQR